MFHYRVFGCDHQGRAVASECSLAGNHNKSDVVRFFQEYSCLISYPHTVTRMECSKLKFKVELLFQPISSKLLCFQAEPQLVIHPPKLRPLCTSDDL